MGARHGSEGLTETQSALSMARTSVPGTPILEEDLARAAFEQQRMDQAAYHLDRIRRDAVREAIQGCVGIVAGICRRPMYEAITCIQWWRRRFRRSE